jgi:cyclopropane-fatty-acyl-phospholipid synthase
MQKIAVGQLRVLTYSSIYTFPAPLPDQNHDNDNDQLKAELRVVNDVFWIRLLTMGDLGFSEAYMFGDVECDDLVATFKAHTLRILFALA